EVYAACVMLDHVHLLFEPQVKKQNADGRTIFWSLTDILQGIKSATSHRINKAAGTHGPVWEKESFDRLIRSESDLHEKFEYICRNPWDAGVAKPGEDYPWMWCVGKETPRPTAEMGTPAACTPQKVATALRDLGAYIEWSPFFHA